MKYVHKPHELPSAMDSNAAQFERQGNPWHGDNRIKVGRRKRRAPTCRAGTPRVPERQSRTESEAFLDVQCKRAIDALIKSASGKSRTVAPLAPPRISPTLAKIDHPNRTELTRWQRFELLCRSEAAKRDFKAKREAAERAYQASEAAKAAERRRLQALIVATEAKLATL